MSRHTRPRHISFLYIIVSFMLSPPSVSAQMMSDDRNHPKEFTALQYGAGYGRMEQKGKQRGDGPVTELKEKLELLDRKKVMIAVCTVFPGRTGGAGGTAAHRGTRAPGLAGEPGAGGASGL